MLEKNKTRWISRNKLIKLLNDYELNENIISIEVIDSKKLSGIKELDSFGNINQQIIVIASKENSLFIGLPFPFNELKPRSCKGIISILNNEITVGVLFFELGSWVSGIIKYKEVLLSKRGSRYVKGKHKAGGQSQRRFERNREKWIEDLNKKVYEDVKKYILPEQNNLDYFILLGEEKSLNEFVKSSNVEKAFGAKIIYRKSSLKNFNSKTIIKSSSNLWSSKIYLDIKNAIVEKI